MTLNRARELIGEQTRFSSGYNRNAVRMILSEVQRLHGRAAVDGLIREFALDQRFGLSVGSDFSSLRG